MKLSGLKFESFFYHQNDNLLNSATLKGLDEDLDTLDKRHNLDLSELNTIALVTLADLLFETIEKKGKGVSTKIWTFSFTN